jgi:GT2 family glycosyltransferase
LTAPEVSVVVAAHQRPARLARLLESLADQSLAPERFEVIVVDDGSAPAVAGVISHHQRCGQLHLRTVRNERPLGPARARNAGWRLAVAPLIAFTDDDCRASPGWLEAAARAAAAEPDAIMQGPTRPDPEDPPAGILSRTQHIETLGPQFQTCNIFYPRTVLEILGGFDERYPLPAGEDTDLAWRAIAAGCPPRFLADAVIFHAVEPLGVRGRLRVAARARGAVRVYRDHPGARVMLHRGVFWTVWHYLLLRAMLLILLPVPSSLRRVVLLRYLRDLVGRARGEGAGVTQIPWAVPFLLLHDGVETAGLVAESLRQRTLVI